MPRAGAVHDLSSVPIWMSRRVDLSSVLRSIDRHSLPNAGIPMTSTAPARRCWANGVLDAIAPARVAERETSSLSAFLTRFIAVCTLERVCTGSIS